jgi:hypothetical protein
LTGNSTGQSPFGINGTGPFVEPPEANSLWVFCGLGGAEALPDAALLEVVSGDALLGDVLTGDGLLGSTLLAATLPVVP